MDFVALDSKPPTWLHYRTSVPCVPDSRESVTSVGESPTSSITRSNMLGKHVPDSLTIVLGSWLWSFRTKFIYSRGDQQNKRAPSDTEILHYPDFSMTILSTQIMHRPLTDRRGDFCMSLCVLWGGLQSKEWVITMIILISSRWLMYNINNQGHSNYIIRNN